LVRRDRHVALGSDGTNLFFTRGNTANAGFYAIAKGATSNWTRWPAFRCPQLSISTAVWVTAASCFDAVSTTTRASRAWIALRLCNTWDKRR
jgi:hypothetical protein